MANLTLNSVLTNSLVNSFTFGFQYWNNVIDSKARVPTLPFPVAMFGTNVNVPQQSYQRKFQFRDDITKTYGNHTFKGGVDYIFNPSWADSSHPTPPWKSTLAQDPSDILALPNGFATPGS